MLRVAVFLLALLAAPSAYAQAVICSLTPGPTTSNTVCANTAFVQGVLNAFVDGGGTSLSVILHSYLSGLTLSNDAGTPNTILDMAAGTAVDSTNAAIIKVGAFTKSTGGSWASGTGQNGMGNGLTIANSTWYHVCLANNSGTPDYWFDTSVTCANRPSGISDTKYRRTGSFKTDGSAHIIAFVQNGDFFEWSVPTADVTAGTFGATTAILTTLNVPTGIIVEAQFMYSIFNGTTTTEVLVSNPALTDTTPSGSLFDAFSFTSAQQSTLFLRRFTNASAQIRERSTSAAATRWIMTRGWWDRRGKDN